LSAAKLASGYIELAVKTDGNAMKDITASITGIEKQAQKSGKAAGEAITKGVSEGSKNAGQAVQDAITSAAEKAGSDAGDAIDKGVTEGAKKAGKSINDEITSAAKKTKDDVAKTKIEPKVDTKSAKDEVGGLGKAIKDAVRNAAKEAGVSLEDIVQGAAKRAGGAIGTAIHDSLQGTAAGDILDDITTRVRAASDGFHHMQDAIAGIKQGDPAGALQDISVALNAIGQTKAGDVVKDIADKAAPLKAKLEGVAGDAKEVTSQLSQFANGAPKMASGFETVGKSLGPIAIALSTISALDSHFAGNLNNFLSGLEQHDLSKVMHSGLGLAGDSLKDYVTGFGLMKAPWELGDKTITSETHTPRIAPGDPTGPDSKLGGMLLGGAGGGGPASLIPIPRKASGGVAGVTDSGKLFGPGTGTSDSILAVGSDGVPTALVSKGEGVVKESAMRNGGDAVVTALNRGLKLPGYDDGTNNVGGDPIPMPEIKVPEATSGQGGGFNQWLQAQQGKAYQYGTMYDCSGFMSQVYNQLTGKQLPRFNTESDLAAYGFVRGSKPGTFQLGIHHGGGGPNGHMAGTLPDGRSVESGGNGVQIGAGAHGASDPQFEDHWFLPGSEGAGAAMPTAVGQGGADAAATPGLGGPGGVMRTGGYIPAGAGNSGTAGTSFLSGLYNMGADAINGLIDQAGSAAATAISAAATAGSFGAGGQAAGPAASFAIGLGTTAAKRGVKYGAQMLGIGTDALIEQLTPFGAPRWLGYDYTGFAPNMQNVGAAVTSVEKALADQQQKGGATAGAPNGAPNAATHGAPINAAPVGNAAAPGVEPVPSSTKSPFGADLGQPTIGNPVAGQAPPGGPSASPSAPGPVVPPPAPPPPPPAQQQQPQNPIDWLKNQYSGMRDGGVVGVFDDGGWLMPNQVAINKSKRPEPILNSQQWDSVQAAAKHQVAEPVPGVGSSSDYSVRINNVTVTDVNELKNQIDSRQRLQMMRYAGRP
jgi:hypothetical protein